jgi:hypothetical protein
MESNEIKPKKKPNIVFRFLAFLLSAAMVLGALALILNRDTLNLDAAVRWFSYRTLERSDNGEAASFANEGTSSSLYSTIGKDFLSCSSSGVHLYSQSGTQYVSDTLTMEHPTYAKSEDAVVVYDAGGNDLYVYLNRTQVFSLTNLDGTIISASLNKADWLTVVTNETGYKAVVTVYNANFEKSVAFHISSAFVTDAVLSDNCNTLATVSLGQDGTAFASTINFYTLKDISDTQSDLAPNVTCSLGDNVILDLMWQNDHLWAMGQSSLSVLSSDGTILSQPNWSSRYLKAFALSKSGFCAVLTGTYKSGTEATLTVYKSDGSVAGEMDVNTQVLSLSASGRYLSVLTGDKSTTYLSNLSIYNELDGTQGAQEVLQRDDGSAFLVSSTAAWLCIPN